jgi:hypothetical protein
MTLRQRVSKDIAILMRIHDRLPMSTHDRKLLEQQILFLMDKVKCAEFEESFN